MKTKQPYATWEEVEFNTLLNKVKIIQIQLQTPILAVVKANGYGHGFISRLQKLPVAWLILNQMIGDEIVLIGKQGDEEITADQVAQTWKTINYEVTCGIGARVPRIFLG